VTCDWFSDDCNVFFWNVHALHLDKLRARTHHSDRWLGFSFDWTIRFLSQRLRTNCVSWKLGFSAFGSKIILETCDFSLELVNCPLLILVKCVHNCDCLIHLDVALLVDSQGFWLGGYFKFQSSDITTVFGFQCIKFCLKVHRSPRNRSFGF